MTNAGARDYFEFCTQHRGDSADWVHRFARKSERHICTLARILTCQKEHLFMVVCINAMQDHCKCRANEELRTFLDCCILSLGRRGHNAYSTHFGLTPRSFLIKNRANSPWNTLDPRKKSGLCFIKLKSQLSPKPT